MEVLLWLLSFQEYLVELWLRYYFEPNKELEKPDNLTTFGRSKLTTSKLLIF
jgi:hypothetical protein